MTTTRLSYDLEQRLEIAAQTRNMAKSDMVREALAKYLDDEESGKSSFELGEPYFGRYGSGDGDLSKDYKNRLREKIHAQLHTH